jgi:transcription initiation factor IIF auxiliary subunit
MTECRKTGNIMEVENDDGSETKRFPVYRWRIYLKEVLETRKRAEMARYVDHVVYDLHPTFLEPTRSLFNVIATKLLYIYIYIYIG